MPIKIAWDCDNGAFYYQIRRGLVAKTISFECGVGLIGVVDVDAKGRSLGVEVIASPRQRLKRFGKVISIKHDKSITMENGACIMRALQVFRCLIFRGKSKLK